MGEKPFIVNSNKSLWVGNPQKKLKNGNSEIKRKIHKGRR